MELETPASCGTSARTEVAKNLGLMRVFDVGAKEVRVNGDQLSLRIFQRNEQWVHASRFFEDRVGTNDRTVVWAVSVRSEGSDADVVYARTIYLNGDPTPVCRDMYQASLETGTD